MICFATAFHNLIQDQKSPERGPPRTPAESLTSLSESVKRVCEATSSTPGLPAFGPSATLQAACCDGNASKASKKPFSHLPRVLWLVDNKHWSSGWLTPAPSDLLRHSFPKSNSRPKIALQRSSPYALRMSNVAFVIRKKSL